MPRVNFGPRITDWVVRNALLLLLLGRRSLLAIESCIGLRAAQRLNSLLFTQHSGVKLQCSDLLGEILTRKISPGYLNPCSLCFPAIVSAKLSRALKSASDGKPLERTGSITSTLRLGIIPAKTSTVLPPHP